MSGLRHRLSQDAQGAIHAAEAERCRMEFEIRALEEELHTRSRITRGEEERLTVRKGLYESELDSLHNNLNKVVGFIASARDQMQKDLSVRKIDGDKIYVDLKKGNDQRVSDIKAEYERAKAAQRHLIADKEAELADMKAQ